MMLFVVAYKMIAILNALGIHGSGRQITVCAKLFKNFAAGSIAAFSPPITMANQIQEMARAVGLNRVNSPAAMGKLYELISGADLSDATVPAKKKILESREPRIIFLDA